MGGAEVAAVQVGQSGLNPTDAPAQARFLNPAIECARGASGAGAIHGAIVYACRRPASAHVAQRRGYRRGGASALLQSLFSG